VQGTEIGSLILHPVGLGHRFSVVLYAKIGKNDVMQGFCSWFSVVEVRLADKLCFMYS